MKGLLMMLKAMGIDDGTIAQLQTFLPQVPTVAKNAIDTLNKALADFDGRLRELESSQEHIQSQLTQIYEHNSNILEVLNGIRSGQLRQSSDTGNAVDIGTASAAGANGNSGTSSGTGSVRRQRGNR
jgi:hypothetical protein